MLDLTTATTTLTNSTEENVFQLSGEKIFEIFFRILIYVAGVAGNLLVIFVILFLSEFRKLAHWYVLQLALADFLFLQTLPFKVSEIINERWIYSVELCRARQTILFFNYYASILFLMIMAVDRYLAVCHSLSSRVQRLRSPTYAYVFTAIVWAVALIMCIPVMIYGDLVGIHQKCFCTLQFPKDPVKWCNNHMKSSLQECLDSSFNNIHKSDCAVQPSVYRPTEDKNSSTDGDDDYSWFNLGSGDAFSGIDIGNDESTAAPDEDGTKIDYFKPGCLYDHERTGWAIFIYFNFIAMFVVPLIVISTCYTLIVLRLKKTHVGVRRDSNAKSTKSTSSTKKIWNPARRKSSSASTGRSYKEKQKVTIMCAVLVLLFVICWLPFHSAHIAKLQGIHTTSDTFCENLAIATSILAYLNSALNPYLYNFLGTFQKRMKQIRNHKRMQSFLSATGLTKIAGRSNSVVSSDGSKGKRPSFPNDSRSASVANERIPLQFLDNDNKTTVAT